MQATGWEIAERVGGKSRWVPCEPCRAGGGQGISRGAPPPCPCLSSVVWWSATGLRCALPVSSECCLWCWGSLVPGCLLPMSIPRPPRLGGPASCSHVPAYSLPLVPWWCSMPCWCPLPLCVVLVLPPFMVPHLGVHALVIYARAPGGCRPFASMSCRLPLHHIGCPYRGPGLDPRRVPPIVSTVQVSFDVRLSAMCHALLMVPGAPA